MSNNSGTGPVNTYNFHFNYPVKPEELATMLEHVGKFAEEQECIAPICKAPNTCTCHTTHKPSDISAMIGVTVDLQDEEIVSSGTVQFNATRRGQYGGYALSVAGEGCNPSSDVVVIGDEDQPYGIIIPFENTIAMSAIKNNPAFCHSICSAMQHIRF